ncbi:hypothetical protein R3P38DRAFT_2761158 [Favolaschia claudopus]|uniref:Uncharacterized protein n=1 Tax=Favolaschia claudopus TaxID=2862362 RepID=A0AAW0DX85_9AGAR
MVPPLPVGARSCFKRLGGVEVVVQEAGIGPHPGVNELEGVLVGVNIASILRIHGRQQGENPLIRVLCFAGLGSAGSSQSGVSPSADSAFHHVSTCYSAHALSLLPCAIITLVDVRGESRPVSLDLWRNPEPLGLHRDNTGNTRRQQGSNKAGSIASLSHPRFRMLGLRFGSGLVEAGTIIFMAAIFY